MFPISWQSPVSVLYVSKSAFWGSFMIYMLCSVLPSSQVIYMSQLIHWVVHYNNLPIVKLLVLHGVYITDLVIDAVSQPLTVILASKTSRAMRKNWWLLI